MRTLLSTVTVLAFAACSGEPAPGPADEYARAAIELGAATCDLVERCCDPGERAAVAAALGGSDAATCAAGFEAGAALREAGLRDGTYALDREALDACLAAARSATCAVLAAADSPCSRVLVGQRLDGAACDDDLACRSGYCREAADATRSCASVPTVGEACVDRCAAGAWCRAVGDVRQCEAGLADGASCAIDEECASGACRGAAPLLETRGTCSAPAPWCDGAG